MIIIAEAGVNHNGNIEMAKKLIDAAAYSGADYVKFQTFSTDALVRKNTELANYQRQNIGNKKSQYEMLKSYELSESDHRILINYCKQKDIKFLSTAFDIPSVDLLHSLGVDLWKIPSGEITNYPLLKHIAQYGGKVIISTGMCNMEDVREAMKVFLENSITLDHIILLHCNTQYPTPKKDVNLRAMLTLGKEFGVSYGYSDHTTGIEVPIAAAALGASVIEKHFTLDKNLAGPDQKASLEPEELKKMIEYVRNIDQCLGNGIKKVTESERENISVARKSIVAACKIKKGEILNENNLATKRPGTGLSPMMWPRVVGTAAIRDFDTDEDICI